MAGVKYRSVPQTSRSLGFLTECIFRWCQLFLQPRGVRKFFIQAAATLLEAVVVARPGQRVLASPRQASSKTMMLCRGRGARPICAACPGRHRIGAGCRNLAAGAAGFLAPGTGIAQSAPPQSGAGWMRHTVYLLA